MSRFSLVALKIVWKMLAECAPGHSVERKLHHYWVLYNGQVYRGLPLGKHGARRDPDVEAGHIRKMIRRLGIEENCAKRFIEF